MRLRTPLAVLLLLLLITATTGTAGDAERATRLIDFTAKDQLDRIHTDEDYAGRAVIIVGFDRKGSDYRDEWVAALRDSLPDSTGTPDSEILPVASLKGVPFFLKGFLKGKFPKEDSRWMLLDWKGQFTQAYRFASDSCSLLVFDVDGNLQCRATAARLDKELLIRLTGCVRGAGQRPE